MSTDTPSKSELRQRLINLRASLPAHERARRDADIGKQLTAWLSSQAPHTLGIYWPMRAEPDLRAFHAEWAARGLRFALPVVIDKNSPLKFLAWTPGEPLRRDGLGVMVPMASAPEVRPDAVLVPCVGFTGERLRLGYGGGFYDRTLAAAPRPQAVGVAYACLRTDFAGAPFDVALDVIVTEDGLV